MTSINLAEELLSTGQVTGATEISLSQINASLINKLIANHDILVVNLNDLTSSTGEKFKDLMRAIIKNRKYCTFGVHGYDKDPRPVCGIPEAKALFNLAAVEYGVLGLICNKLTLGMLPAENANMYLAQEIDEYTSCCIGKYICQADSTNSAISVNLDDKESLIQKSMQVYYDLYKDVI